LQGAPHQAGFQMGLTEAAPWHGLAVVAGRYRDLTMLGEGGMAYAYRAYDANLQTDVVIKAPREEMVRTQDQLARFEQEIRALINLSFPHIVPIIDVGRHNEMPFAVMRFLSGGSLADYAKRQGQSAQMSVASLGAWLASIAKALDFVHAKQFLHRDVKPSNILFDSHKQAYLSDFGVVKVLDVGDQRKMPGLTEQNFVIGTVDYLAPELLTGQPCDGRADQYALAITIYQVLSGRLPIGGGSAAETIAAQLREVPLPLSSVAPHVPKAVSAAVSRALSKNRNDRFGSCVELARVVLRAVAEAPRATKTSQTGVSIPSPADPLPSATSDADSTAAARPTTNEPAAVHLTTIISVGTEGPRAESLTSNESYSTLARPTAWKWYGFGAVAVILGLGLMWTVWPKAESIVSPSTSASSADRLARELSDLNDQITTSEKAIVVDSQSMRAQPQYESATEFSELIAAQGSAPRAELERQLPILRQELQSLGSLRKQRLEELQNLLASGNKVGGSATDERLEILKLEQRALGEQESQLASLGRRLDALRRSLDSVTTSFDPGAATELTALREIEAAALATSPVAISLASSQRAAELVEAGPPALAWIALNCVARTKESVQIDLAIKRLPTLTPERQADLCWSLLLSGYEPAIKAVTRFGQDHSELANRLQVDQLLALAESQPAVYSPLYTQWGGWCRNSDERLRLFRIQSPLLTDGSTEEVQKACETGLLQDRLDQVLFVILANHHLRAYGVAAQVLRQNSKVSIESLPADQIPVWLSEDAVLGKQLSVRFLVRGSAQQRSAALDEYRRVNSTIDLNDLHKLLSENDCTEPTQLLNLLLSKSDNVTVDLAQFMLEHTPRLSASQIDYSKISPEAADRPAVGESLMKMAWKASPESLRWARHQLLGPEFVQQLASANHNRTLQMASLDTLIPVLDNKQVRLNNSGASGDRGLVLRVKEFLRLPVGCDASPWGPEAEAQATLTALIARATSVLHSCPKEAKADLDHIDEYLKALQALHECTYAVTKIYQVTVHDQLAGARRALRTKPEESWTFRFVKSMLDAYSEQRTGYEALLTRVNSAHRTLPPDLQ
jgi:serine/threonine protein kinase